MNCLVTAGPTYEPLDQVRRLTNFSTGRLGSELAQFLAHRGHSVTLLLGQHATYQVNPGAVRREIFTTTEDLRTRLQARANQPIDAVFHAAAVSDFTFGKVLHKLPSGEMQEIHSGKISTRIGELLVELRPTSKIISELRTWYPRATLVGWKYEVEGGHAGALAMAQKQITDNHTNACVANGPAYGLGFGLVRPALQPQHLRSSEALFTALERLLPT